MRLWDPYEGFGGAPGADGSAETMEPAANLEQAAINRACGVALLDLAITGTGDFLLLSGVGAGAGMMLKGRTMLRLGAAGVEEGTRRGIGRNARRYAFKSDILTSAGAQTIRTELWQVYGGGVLYHVPSFETAVDLLDFFPGLATLKKIYEAGVACTARP